MKKVLLLSLALPFSCSTDAVSTSSIIRLGISAVPPAAALFMGGVLAREICVGKNDGGRGMRIMLSTGMAGCFGMLAAAIAQPAFDIEYEIIPQSAIYTIKRIKGIN